MVSMGGQPDVASTAWGASGSGGAPAPTEAGGTAAAVSHPLASIAAGAVPPSPDSNTPPQVINGKPAEHKEALGQAAKNGEQQPQSLGSPASPTAAAAAHAVHEHAHADAKLLAEIRVEMERQRGKMTLERRRQVAARLMEHKARRSGFGVQELGVSVCGWDRGHLCK